MTSFETVLYHVDRRVATITMNRPEALNAFNRQLRHDLMQAIFQAAADDEIRAVVLTGAGRAFSAGADLSEDNGPGFLPQYQQNRLTSSADAREGISAFMGKRKPAFVGR
ncbi:MAG: Enoyl-CoA hydratase [Hydrocarboniphaga sp.]|uniref:enoyl-CoA hydratase/isomerase family protein n=1 Tax=Hydrocarboniphaga sp. TaxID=2033016 RepID=UPI00263706BF|nr:enoyl-CoA hydratase/isomerase family protein [Hydrocarboniphaga sp.]MDB5969978.1 Enoyl-CoA hydratase [Hydrocarboniphaga sp.]